MHRVFGIDAIRQSKLYKGFVIEKHCFKVSLFADDTVIYLNGNQ